MTREKVRVYLLAVLCSTSLLSSSALLAQKSDKDCQCRAPGGDMRDLGTVECVQIGGTAKLVTCTMSTNTPYWKDVENVEGCPSA
ncbi:MAG: hypothetical protein AB8B87_10925 [Granulosicoccus sp.]